MTVDVPTPRGADARACRALVDVLPRTVSDQPRREVDSGRVPAAAWGDPPIVLTCGVAMPDEFDAFAACTEVDGVGWFVPEQQMSDPDAVVVMTTIGRAQNVQVSLPARYRPPAVAMVDLAQAIRGTIALRQPCV